MLYCAVRYRVSKHDYFDLAHAEPTSFPTRQKIRVPGFEPGSSRVMLESDLC